MNGELKKPSPKTLPKIKVAKDEMDQFPVEMLEIDPFWKEVYEGKNQKKTHETKRRTT